MHTSLFDVTVTLKRQRKIVNIFFLQQDTFFYMKMNVWHFYQKMHTELHSGLHYIGYQRTRSWESRRQKRVKLNEVEYNLKAPITTAADDKFCDIFSQILKK